MKKSDMQFCLFVWFVLFCFFLCTDKPQRCHLKVSNIAEGCTWKSFCPNFYSFPAFPRPQPSFWCGVWVVWLIFDPKFLAEEEVSADLSEAGWKVLLQN